MRCASHHQKTKKERHAKINPSLQIVGVIAINIPDLTIVALEEEASDVYIPIKCAVPSDERAAARKSPKKEREMPANNVRSLFFTQLTTIQF